MRNNERHAMQCGVVVGKQQPIQAVSYTAGLAGWLIHEHGRIGITVAEVELCEVREGGRVNGVISQTA